MKKFTAAILMDAATQTGIACESRDNYSGRGMYGEKTNALVVETNPNGWGDLLQLVAIGSVEAKRLDDSQEEVYESSEHGEVAVESWDLFCEDVSKLRTDNMGRDAIVVY